MYVCVRVDLCMCARDAVLVQLLESIDFGWNWDKPRAREVFGAFRGIVSRFSMRFSGAMSAQRATFFFFSLLLLQYVDSGYSRWSQIRVIFWCVQDWSMISSFS